LIGGLQRISGRTPLDLQGLARCFGVFVVLRIRWLIPAKGLIPYRWRKDRTAVSLGPPLLCTFVVSFVDPLPAGDILFVRGQEKKVKLGTMLDIQTGFEGFRR